LESRKPQDLKCILCEKEFSASDTHLFEPLEFFDDVCFCKECLTTEFEGQLAPESH